jgi:SAM-dependent methyltransferase
VRVADSKSSEEMRLLGERGGEHPLAAFVDHTETYGPRVIERFVRSLSAVESAVDLGAGLGRDLHIIRKAHPRSRLAAVEGGRQYAEGLRRLADEVHVLDIEHDALPFKTESLDLVISNQVLEHIKEVFWVFHEVSRSLRVGGRFLIGVPNVASLHNRVLLLFGIHPTQHKLCSAHVRPFSRRDTLRFLEACFPGGYVLEKFSGAQFYPFPVSLARPLARVFPTGAFSIFFLLRKVRAYRDEFATYPSRARLETNFWTGNVITGTQYESET